MKDPRIWVKAALVMIPLPALFFNGAYAMAAVEPINGEILLTTYDAKQKELEKYSELRVLLQKGGINELVVDQALFQLLGTKIELVEEEITELKDQFWNVPLAELVNYSLPEVKYPIDRVDMDRVKEAWLTWVNDLRASKGLPPYEYHKLLDHTSQEVADYLAVKYPKARPTNLATHEKPGQTTNGYSHSYLTKWFKERGVYTVAKGRSNHTENTGYSYYRCEKEDCTDEMIRALRTTFAYYKNEERFLSYAPSRALHYKSLVNPNYKYIGLGLATSPNANRRWSVLHYMTELQAMDAEKLESQWYAQYLPLW